MRYGISSASSSVCSGTYKKNSKLRVTDLRKGNPPVTGGFHTQKASNEESVSIYDVIMGYVFIICYYVNFSTRAPHLPTDRPT